MMRGINRQQIMEDDEDYQKFLQTLKYYKKISGYKLYAYCLMGNHVHMIIKVEKEALEQIFKRICGRYAYWFNTKYLRAGHLFQDRFRSGPIEDEGYFLSVLRYIHQNPLKAGYASNIDEYPYSSYRCYLEPEENHLVDVDFALNMMSMKEFVEYQNTVNKNEDKDTGKGKGKDWDEDNTEDKYLEIVEPSRRFTDEQAKGIINRISKCKNAADYQRLEVSIRNSYIGEFRREGLSVRQISRLTGISKGIVERCDGHWRRILSNNNLKNI
ncbi:MAG: transposase [Eubacteriales bacterium]|nr:transposase [Eubacteriales bacterium]